MLRNFIYRTLVVVGTSSFLIYFNLYLLNIDPVIIVYFLPVYFGLVNILFMLLLQKSINQTISQFTSKYLLGTAIRFISGLLFVIIFVLLNKQSSVVFVVVFAALYFVFLVHEILEMLVYFRKTKPDEVNMKMNSEN